MLPTRLALLLAALVVTSSAAARGPAAPAARGADAGPRRDGAAAVAHYLRARLAARAGDRGAALESMQAALVADPHSPQLRTAYADLLRRDGQLDRAEGEARRALELAAGELAARADAELVMGKVLADAGRAGEALVALDAAAQHEAERFRAVRDDPDDRVDPDPWRLAARLRLEMGQAPAALATGERLAALDAELAADLLRDLGGRELERHELDAAAKALARATELAPAEPEGWRLLAEAEQSRDRVPEARRALERALACDPDDLETLLALGDLALRQDDLPGARAWLKQALRLAPDEANGRVRVASAWLDARQPGEALAVIDAAGAPGSPGGLEEPRLLYLRGLALEQLHRWDEAAATFARVRPASGDLYATARINLAHALARAGKPAEAVRAVRRGLEASPKDPALLYALGEAYDRAGRRDAALEQMRAVLAVKADHAEAMNFIGFAYAERGEKLDEAERLVERALALAPENGYYVDSLGWVLYKRGDTVRAVKALEHAVELLGPDPTVLEHLGDAYVAAQRSPEAQDAYRRALAALDDADAAADAAPGARDTLEGKLRQLGDEPRPVTSRR